MKVWSSQLCLRFKQSQLGPKNVNLFLCSVFGVGYYNIKNPWSFQRSIIIDFVAYQVLCMETWL